MNLKANFTFYCYIDVKSTHESQVTTNQRVQNFNIFIVELDLFKDMNSFPNMNKSIMHIAHNPS